MIVYYNYILKVQTYECAKSSLTIKLVAGVDYLCVKRPRFTREVIRKNLLLRNFCPTT